MLKRHGLTTSFIIHDKDSTMDGEVLMITYEVYEEVLKVWNHELPDDFEICSELFPLTDEQNSEECFNV